MLIDIKKAEIGIFIEYDSGAWQKRCFLKKEHVYFAIDTDPGYNHSFYNIWNLNKKYLGLSKQYRIKALKKRITIRTIRCL